jgi:hypothetical protein
MLFTGTIPPAYLRKPFWLSYGAVCLLQKTAEYCQINELHSSPLDPLPPEVFMNAYILQTLIINGKFNFLLARYLTTVSNMEFKVRTDI